MWFYLPDTVKHCEESVVADIMMVRPQAVGVYSCHLSTGEVRQDGCLSLGYILSTQPWGSIRSTSENKTTVTVIEAGDRTDHKDPWKTRMLCFFDWVMVPLVKFVARCTFYVDSIFQ